MAVLAVLCASSLSPARSFGRSADGLGGTFGWLRAGKCCIEVAGRKNLGGVKLFWYFLKKALGSLYNKGK